MRTEQEIRQALQVAIEGQRYWYNQWQSNLTLLKQASDKFSDKYAEYLDMTMTAKAYYEQHCVKVDALKFVVGEEEG